MALKREVSLGVGLATAALVWGVFNSALPSVADVRVGEKDDQDIASAERSATWISAAAVAAVSLLAKDPTVFILGGGMTVALAWWHRHANMYSPVTGTAMTPSSRQVMSEEMTAVSNGYAPA